MAERLNDKAWEALFEKYRILDRITAESKFVISAQQIKEYREPRLMAKFDHKINLPQIFAEHELAILPISRGDYVISHFEAYQPFETKSAAVSRISLPGSIQSLDAVNIPSEAIAINCALASGMLADFLQEENLFATVSGRMGSGYFDYRIRNGRTGGYIGVEVGNSQIEIDAAFEGNDSLALLEAKRDISEDFLIRQLYYPFRTWNSRIPKRVRPIFLVYSNGIFSLYEYEFQETDSYNSLVLVKQKNYSIEDTTITIADVLDILGGCTVIEEPEIAFPQADRFERVINICELTAAQELSREQVTEEYAFDIRQTNYYTDAARYLGLLEKHYGEGRRPVYNLSALGKRVMSLNYKQRQLALVRQILQHKAFQEVFRICMATGIMPEKNRIIDVMRRSNLYRVESESTFGRRASTISGWLNWVLSLLM